jgi:hypothetical protein
MKIGFPKPQDILNIATKMAGPLLGGPIGAGLSAAFNLGKTLGEMKSTFSKLQSSLQQSPLTPSSTTAQRPQPFSVTKINITIIQNPAQAATQSPNQRFQMAPIVGNDSQWPGFSQAANSRITGNSNGLFDGTNPWAKNDGRTEERAAVGWVMQQNDSLRYDANNKSFYTTGADGSRTDKLSLDQVVNTIRAHGGASPTTGSAFQAVGKLANDAAHAAKPATPQQNPFQAIMDMFKQVMNAFQQMLSAQFGPAGQGAASLAGGFASGAGSAAGGFPSIGPASSFLSPMSGGSGNTVSSHPANGGSSAGAPSTASGWGDSSPATGAASGASAGSGPGGGNLDSMMSQAESLMKSGKMEDQLKAQKMMQQVMRTFELLSKMIEKQSEMASKAIAAIK